MKIKEMMNESSGKFSIPKGFSAKKEDLVRGINEYHKTTNVLYAAKILVWLYKHSGDILDIIEADERDEDGYPLVKASSSFVKSVGDEKKQYDVLASLVEKA